jgi:hypothetical protein
MARFRTYDGDEWYVREAAALDAVDRLGVSDELNQVQKPE